MRSMKVAVEEAEEEETSRPQEGEEGEELLMSKIQQDRLETSERRFLIQVDAFNWHNQNESSKRIKTIAKDRRLN